MILWDTLKKLWPEPGQKESIDVDMLESIAEDLRTHANCMDERNWLPLTARKLRQYATYIERAIGK